MKTKRHDVVYDISREYVRVGQRDVSRFARLRASPPLLDVIGKDDWVKPDDYGANREPEAK